MTEAQRQLGPVLATCSNAGCPTVFGPDESGMLVVQGYAADEYGAAPDGEFRVKLPTQVLLAAARQLGQ